MGYKGRLTKSTGKFLGYLGFGNGLVEPNLGIRGPQIQQNLKASDAALSVGWAGWPIGMWIASMLGGRLVERIGAGRLTFWGGLLYVIPFTFVGYATNIAMFMALLLLVGLGNGFFDVGWGRLSAHYDKLRRQEVGESSGLVIQLLNGLFSLGSVVASLMGLLIVAVHVPLTWHLAGVGIFVLAILVLARKHLPNPGATDDDVDDDAIEVVEEGPRGRTPGKLRAIAAVGGLVVLPVGIGYLWSSIYLTRQGASPAVAAFGLIAFTAAETIIRLSIGKLSQRFSALRDAVLLTRIGAAVALVGVLLMVVPQTIATTVVGLGLLAAGMAPIAPLAQLAAQEAWPQHKGRASAMVSRYIYTALVAGPVIIGPLSTSLGSTDSVTPLRIALACLVVLPAAVLALSRFMQITTPVED